VPLSATFFSVPVSVCVSPVAAQRIVVIARAIIARRCIEASQLRGIEIGAEPILAG
jgi:hypothetical protein